MAQISRQVGTTSQVTLLFIQDSSSTTGAGLTGLAYNSGSLACYYKRSNGTASVAVSLVTITTLGTYASGGFKEVDATNLPGVYEFHPPNAALASGADSVAFMLKGATNMAPCPLIIELTGTSNQDAVRGGMTALPNANASASGGLLTFGASTGQVNPSSGKVPATLASTDVTGNVACDLQTIKTQTVTCAGGVTVPAATLASTTNITAGTITTVTTLTNLPTAPTDWLTSAAVSAGAVTKIQSGLSTYAGGDTSGTTTLLSRVTSTRAGYLDNLTNLDAAVSTRSTYAGADTSGTTTLLSRVTAAVALAGTAPDWYADVTATGTVTGSPTTTSVPLTGLTGPVTDKSYLVITSGALKGQGRPITNVSGSTVTVSPAFAAAPLSGVSVRIVGYHA